MTGFLALPDPENAWMGLVPAAVIVIALIVNTASLGKRDTNYKCAFATNILCVALLVESAAWTVEIFGGGTSIGIYWALVTGGALHIVAASVAAKGLWEFRSRTHWSHGRQRATWGIWLSIAMLFVLAAWFHLQSHQDLAERIFG